MPVRWSFLSTEGSQAPQAAGAARAAGAWLPVCGCPPAQDGSSATLPAGQAGHSEVAEWQARLGGTSPETATPAGEGRMGGQSLQPSGSQCSTVRTGAPHKDWASYKDGTAP